MSSDKTKEITGVELCSLLKISRTTLSLLMKEGCPCIYYGRITEPRRGSRPRYNLAEVKAWLASRNKQTAKEGVTA